jgi:hypothetical protein
MLFLALEASGFSPQATVTGWIATDFDRRFRKKFSSSL